MSFCPSGLDKLKLVLLAERLALDAHLRVLYRGEKFILAAIGDVVVPSFRADAQGAVVFLQGLFGMKRGGSAALDKSAIEHHAIGEIDFEIVGREFALVGEVPGDKEDFPSAILRASEEDQRHAQYREFVADLEKVREMLDAA